MRLAELHEYLNESLAQTHGLWSLRMEERKRPAQCQLGAIQLDQLSSGQFCLDTDSEYIAYAQSSGHKTFDCFGAGDFLEEIQAGGREFEVPEMIFHELTAAGPGFSNNQRLGQDGFGAGALDFGKWRSGGGDPNDFILQKRNGLNFRALAGSLDQGQIYALIKQSAYDGFGVAIQNVALDRRKKLFEAGQPLGQYKGEEGFVASQSQAARGDAGRGLKMLRDVLVSLGNLLDVLEINQAGIGHAHAMRCPDEEWNAQVFLQKPNMTGDSRLG